MTSHHSASHSLSHSVGLTTPTPRRSTFNIPTNTRESYELPSTTTTRSQRENEEREQFLRRPSSLTPSSPSSGLSSIGLATGYGNENRYGSYKDPSKIPLKTIALTVLFAGVVIGLLVWSGKTTVFIPSSTNSSSSALASPSSSSQSKPKLGGGAGSQTSSTTNNSKEIIETNQDQNPNAQPPTSWPYPSSVYINQCLDHLSSHHPHYGYWNGHVPPDSGPIPLYEPSEDGTTPSPGDLHPISGLPICTSSITYLLSPHVGLGYHIMILSQAWGLAIQRGKAFFIESDGWDRGEWEDHFLSWDNRHLEGTGEEGCVRPPRDQLKAAPRTTRHWIVASFTANFHFGHEFQNEFENPKAHYINRQLPIYQTAIDAIEELLRPSSKNQELIDLAFDEIRDDEGEVAPFLAVHLRRGDRLASVWKYHTGYIPLENYIKEVNKTWNRLRDYDIALPEYPNVFIATDSPSTAQELINLSPSTWRFFTLSDSDSEELQRISSPKDYYQSEWKTVMDHEKRVELTRGVIVEMALLGGGWGRSHLDVYRFREDRVDAREEEMVGEGSGSDSGEAKDDDREEELEGEMEIEELRPLATICTLSSNICKFVAVQLGWEMSFEEDLWRDVDMAGAVDWSWFPTSR